MTADTNQTPAELIKVFTTPECGFCKVVKNYLRSLELEFTEVDLTKDQASLEWLVNQTGQVGVPVTVFDDSQFVVGWQKEAIDVHLRDLKLIS